LKQSLAIVLVTLALLGLPVATGGTAPAGARQPVPRPVTRHAFADPSVMRYAGGYLAISTGRRAPGAVASSPTGRWRSTGPLLHHLPAWVAPGGIWAADAAHIGRRWVMYYAAPVRGLGAGARCIGVALSSDPSRGFDARGRKPLVCPAGARGRHADDRLRGRSRRLPQAGVIDPSFFRRGHQMYLLYRTQRTPATIRIVRLHHGGRRAARHSRQVLALRHIVENPVLLHRGHRYILITSQGYYGSCAYTTTWRSSRSPFHFPVRGHRLLDDGRTRVCGPGGLDVVSRRLVFFHGWVCGDRSGAGRRCSFGQHVDLRRSARRTLYAGRLRWRHGRPHVHFLRG